MLADESLSPFFDGVDIDRLRQTQEGFFSMALGGPDEYTGRSMGDAHAGSRYKGMDDATFDHFLGVFGGVLVDLGVPDAKLGELVEVFEGARDQVLGRRGSRGPDGDRAIQR